MPQTSKVAHSSGILLRNINVVNNICLTPQCTTTLFATTLPQVFKSKRLVIEVWVRRRLFGRKSFGFFGSVFGFCALSLGKTGWVSIYEARVRLMLRTRAEITCTSCLGGRGSCRAVVRHNCKHRLNIGMFPGFGSAGASPSRGRSLALPLIDIVKSVSSFFCTPPNRILVTRKTLFSLLRPGRRMTTL